MKETKGNSIRCCLIEGENLQESLSCAIQDEEVLAELGKWRNFAMPLHTGPQATSIGARASLPYSSFLPTPQFLGYFY